MNEQDIKRIYNLLEEGIEVRWMKPDGYLMRIVEIKVDPEDENDHIVLFDRESGGGYAIVSNTEIHDYYEVKSLGDFKC